jgi:hypothetical protein
MNIELNKNEVDFKVLISIEPNGTEAVFLVVCDPSMNEL